MPCKPCQRESARERAKRYRKDPAKRLTLNASDRRKRERNPEVYAAIRARFYEKHPEYDREKRAKLSARRLADPTLDFHIRHRRNENAKRHPSRVVAKARRRAREKGAGSGVTTEEWLTIVEAFGRRCAYCGKRRELTIEHVVPIAKGGSNDASNIVPACLPCNQRKNAKSVEEFLGRSFDAAPVR